MKSGKKLLYLIFGLVMVLAFSILTGAAEAQTACDGLSGRAFGLCVAAEHSGCTDTSNDSEACIKLAELYVDTVEGPPPWQPCPCYSLGSLNDHVIVLRESENLYDYGCVDRESAGTLGIWISTGSADYEVGSSYQDDYWGTQCHFIDITYGYNIYNFVYDITLEQAQACRDILLASDMWAVNLCPTFP